MARLCIAGLVVALLSPAALAQTSPDTELVYYDVPDEAGRLSGGVIRLPMPNRDGLTIAAPFRTLVYRGDPANRVDLVFVGDGYTADELEQYAIDVDTLSVGLLADEPYATYLPYFNLHAVEVVSPESGVDHDPTFGIYKDTALDMGFWCGNIERLLCVDVGKAYAHANNAPDVDQVLAIANSSKYGGAGYSGSELATSSSRNSWAPEVLIHELGHSLGNLADEYHYGDGTTYSGNEPRAVNASTLTRPEMEAQERKWFRWMDVSRAGFDGPIDTYEGAVYKQYGVYRPSPNSKMNALGRPFNLPSAEGTVVEIYKIVRPIENASPDATLHGGERLFVEVLQPIGHDLEIQWLINDVPIVGATETEFALCEQPIEDGMHVVTVRVIDPTDMVRNEALRDQYLTQDYSWFLVYSGPPADFNDDGTVNTVDFLAFLNAWVAGDSSADMNHDGEVNTLDVLGFLSLYTSGCLS